MSFRDALSNVGNKTAFYEYFNDFFNFTAADWTITTTEAGAGSASEALTNAAGGQLLITNDAADNDHDFFQLPAEAFKLVAGKRFYFGIRFKTNDATETDIIAGLVITDTTPLAHTDGIAFIKDDGDTNIDLTVTKDSTETEVAAVGTLADDTFVTLEFYYDGRTDTDGAISADSVVQIFVDGTRVAAAALTNMPDDEELTLTFGIQNGAAAAKTLTVDWVRAFVER